MQITLDRYAEGTSHLLAWFITLAIAWTAHLGPGYALRRSFVALPFAFAAVTIIFTLPGQPLMTIPIGGWTITASDTGLIRFASIVTRSWIAVQMAILLTATTRFPDLMHALRHLRVPALIVAIVGFMYRYLSVLSDEAFRLLRAREARSAGIDGRSSGGSIVWRAQVVGHMAGQLFLRSYERSDRIYSAMQARGYAGEFLTINPHIMRPKDWRGLAVIVLVCIAIQLVGRLI
jgi:cobalt/nickel transport system permease protein